MATSWTQLISEIESVKPPDEIIKMAVQFLTDDAKLKDPASATGVTEADLEKIKLPELLPAAALVRRLVRSVEALDKARMAQAATKSALAATPVSAKALASALAPPKMPDVSDLLQKAGLSKLGFHVQADQSLYNTLQLASEEAKAQSRVAFSYVDLTTKEVLPLWLPADSVGGKFTLRDEEESKLAGHQTIGSLSDLSKALKGATATPRFFRNVQQWVAAFLRYATTAIATEQMTWPIALAHMDVVLQICEQEKVKGQQCWAPAKSCSLLEQLLFPIWRGEEALEGTWFANLWLLILLSKAPEPSPLVILLAALMVFKPPESLWLSLVDSMPKFAIPGDRYLNLSCVSCVM
eukprot:Skav224363  [mRNA]  locus=scaffold5095:66265:73933:+ [translate_table: standard]